MASSLIGNSRRIVIYTRGLKTLSNSFRCFSSQDSNKPEKSHVYVDDDEENLSSTVWPDASLGILGPKDVRLPLPGNVGFAGNIYRRKKFTKNMRIIPHIPDILTTTLPSDRHQSVLSQIVQNEEEDLTQELEDELMKCVDQNHHSGEMLECVAQECPELIRKDFKDLFPDRDISTGPFTVITLCQKTVNDMTTWSTAMEEERDELTEFFVAAAEDICGKLNHHGYWADFIDPTSGRPYLGKYTNATMFETDERYRHFGFSIEDLGCCKVISHHLWGTRTFVGSLFANVSIDSSLLKEILRKYTSSNRN